MNRHYDSFTVNQTLVQKKFVIYVKNPTVFIEKKFLELISFDTEKKHMYGIGEKNIKIMLIFSFFPACWSVE